MNLDKKYPHISFKPKWVLTQETIYKLGQCDAIIKAMSETPIQPNYRRKLLNVSLIKGAQSTTAIEGNTLTEEEIQKIEQGEKLAPSKKYQEQEVRNIIDAFNTLLSEIVNNNQGNIITKQLILRFHKMVGKDLGNNFEAIPGKIRTHNVSVGKYKAPNYEDVETLLDQFCDWIKSEFHFSKGQNFLESIIQAIVSHAYIAWIHPFGDGNGRTARLLEFYLLLRAGNPDFASHLFSNFYNQTRPEYYHHLNNSTKTGDLTEFIEYAIQGYKDGLFEILELIQSQQFEISWKNHIYNIFSGKKVTAKTETLNKRRRSLILAIPTNREMTLSEMMKSNIDIVSLYAGLSTRTIDRDVKELLNLELLVQVNSFTYKANIDILKKYVSRKIEKTIKWSDFTT